MLIVIAFLWSPTAAATAAATTSFPARTALHTRVSAPHGWQVGPVAAAEREVTFSFALHHDPQNVARLMELALAVADPLSSQYRLFRSKHEVLALVAPPATIRDLLTQQLSSFGVAPHEIQDLGDALDVRMSVATATKLFATTFHEFHSTDSTVKQRTVVRAMGPTSLPSEFAVHVALVLGLSSFPIPHLNARRHFCHTLADHAPRVGCKATDDFVAVIPQSYLNQYNVPTQDLANTPTSQGVVEFSGENYSPADLNTYATQVDIQIAMPTSNTTVGPNDPTDPQPEPQVDIEAIAAINDTAENWFWMESGDGWLYAFATHFFHASPNIPSVASISYAWSEQDQCNVNVTGPECNQMGLNSETFVHRVNTEFAKIALLGVSLLAASGDSGANGRTDPDCSGQHLHPDFPAVSPWITSVGATQLQNAKVITNPPPICSPWLIVDLVCITNGTEIAVVQDVAGFASGGGFSWWTPRPDWQQAAVFPYLNEYASLLPPASMFNASGRAHPDVAMLVRACQPLWSWLASIHFLLSLWCMPFHVSGMCACMYACFFCVCVFGRDTIF
jgi:subtilase family serine protease